MQRLFLKPADEFWKAQLRASGAIRSGISGRPSVQSIPVEIDAVKASVGPIWPLALHAHFTDAQRQLLTACDQLRSSIVGSTKVLHVLDDVLMSTAGVGRLPPIPLHAALAAKHIPLASLLPVGYHVTLPASFEAHEFASHISGITTAWRRRCQVLEEPKDITPVDIFVVPCMQGKFPVWNHLWGDHPPRNSSGADRQGVYASLNAVVIFTR
jgi:hypothetical protein